MVTEPQVLGLRREADALLVELRIPRELHQLKGHFPQLPIVPGVLLLKWALELARQHFDLPPVFQRLSGVKFMRVMPLDAAVRLVLRCKGGELSFEYLDGGRNCASGRAHYA